MMSAYSGLFSSGLLAPSHAISSFRLHTPQPPSSPIISPPSPADPIDRDLSLTPTQVLSSNAMLISPGPSSGFAAMAADAQRPRLRKRRSSISITTSPMASLKSPTRNAGSALQRTGLLSSSRSRSESVNEYGLGVASSGTSMAGRMRSVTGVLRSRRVIRKASGPAPTAPLPDLPAPSHSMQSSFQMPQTSLPPPPSSFSLAAPNPRRPLSHRLHSLNLHNLHPQSAGFGSSPFGVSSPEFSPVSPATKSATDLGLGAPFQFQLAGDEYRIDEAMKEN